jgi:hypothetical protein
MSVALFRLLAARRWPALVIALTLLLATSCSDDRLTEPRLDSPRMLEAAECAGVCLRDNFSDGDGTLLESHTPDGEGDPFQWIRGGDPGNNSFARIQDNAVEPADDAFPRYDYFADAGAGLDLVEADIAVVQPVSRQQEVMFYLRATPERGFIGDGWALRLIIFGSGNAEIDLYKAGSTATFVQTAEPWLPGTTYHARFEIVGNQVLNFYIDGQLRLSYADGDEPLGPGTVGIGGYRDGPAQVRVTGFAAGSFPPPVFTVACTPAPVVRGEPVTCTASTPNPGDQFTITEWRFEAPELSAPIVEASTSATWPGIAATGGTVRVKGTIGGTPAEGSGPLDVAARTWGSGPDTVAFKITPVTPSALPERPTRVGLLGNTAAVAGGAVKPDGFAQIPSGPNKGVLYVTTVPVEAESRVDINRVALSLNSAFYLLQLKKLRKGDPPDQCIRADVLPFLPKVEQHEGLHLEPGSHSFVFRQELNLHVPQATEHVVSLGDVSLLQGRADAAAQPGIQAAALKARDQINGGTVPPVPYCRFAFFPGP